MTEKKTKRKHINIISILYQKKNHNANENSEIEKEIILYIIIRRNIYIT
jgi:hypothetical protein